MNLMQRLREKGRDINKRFFGLEYSVIGPDGVVRTHEANDPETKLKTEQILFNTIEIDPRTGEEIEISSPNITISVDSIDPAPKEGENWIFTLPVDASPNAETKQWAMNKNRFEREPALGKIRLYMVELEQS